MRERKAAVLTKNELDHLFEVIKTERHAVRNAAVIPLSCDLGQQHRLHLNPKTTSKSNHQLKDE